MITNYNQNKKDVLDLYKKFLEVVAEVKYPAPDNKFIIALKNQAKEIEKDKFLLMVAGEAKSGKSSFINAYLGREILPMDVKQCTSAIIEIKYGEQFVLNAEYADDRKEEVLKEGIHDFLLKNAALNDEFRDIPITTINNEILVKYKGDIPDRVINDLINGVQSENVYGLSTTEYDKKIRQYVEMNKRKWADIVTKIVIEYPFEDENLRGIEIVDSPGVNAKGRVGDITDDYIEKANAIMFLKPITGAALASVSFRSFLEQNSDERNQNALFLVLTRAADETSDNLAHLRQEALELYGNMIQKDHIICVDSKVELFNHKIAGMTVEEIQAKLDELDELGQLNACLYADWGKSRNNKDRYVERLKSTSNFATVHRALNSFGRRAHYLALSEFLGRMLKVFTSIEEKLNEQIELNQIKAKDPTELALKIANIKACLNEINEKMGKKVNEIYLSYGGDSGIIRKKTNKGFVELKKQIEQIPGEDFNMLEKISFRKIDESKQFVAEMQKKIVAECNQALVELSNAKEIRYSQLEPDFTPEMFGDIIRTTKEKANEEITYTTGITFKKTHTKSIYSQKKHFEKVKQSILQRLKILQNQVEDDLIRFADEISSVYIKELFSNARAKEKELNLLLDEKKNAEQLQTFIDEVHKQLVRIKQLVNDVRERKGGIDQCMISKE